MTPCASMREQACELAYALKVDLESLLCRCCRELKSFLLAVAHKDNRVFEQSDWYKVMVAETNKGAAESARAKFNDAEEEERLELELADEEDARIRDVLPSDDEYSGSDDDDDRDDDDRDGDSEHQLQLKEHQLNAGAGAASFLPDDDDDDDEWC
jgi:hypothetical protein